MIKGKILFLAGTATRFVLGSKAGRQTHERIKAKTKRIWGDPSVQTAVVQGANGAVIGWTDIKVSKAANPVMATVS